MRLLPLSWTHRKQFDLDDSGDRKCYCGHSRYQHLSSLGCGVPMCNCYSPRYPYKWIPRREKNA